MLVDKPPRIRRTNHNTQLTYNLTSRVHNVKTYPVLSPQGATIILYGHDHGVTVVWRGGRRFKSSTAAPPPPPRPADSIMIIDDDEDNKEAVAAAIRSRGGPEFEDEVDDSPHPEVVQTLELGVGGAVLHVATPPMAPCAAEDAAWGGVGLLKERMVFAVSCASNDAYLVTLPLTPPSPEAMARPELKEGLLSGRLGSGVWGETAVFLQGLAAQVHGLAMASVVVAAAAVTKVKEDADAPTLSKPRIVVAAHTREAAGVLRLWDVVLDGRGHAENGSVSPFQTEYLPNFASSIAFNPAHASQLLVVFPQHAARVYDYAVPSIFPADPTIGPFPPTGSWLLSLYAPFSRPSGTRKPLLDAAWVAHGRAVLALLADGMWGVWDVDGANPSASNMLGKQSPGLCGAAITAFSTSGFVEGTVRGAPQSSTTTTRSEFAPMTPHTRKDAAFTFGASPSTTPSTSLFAVRGGISVTALATSRASVDEAAVLWVGGLDHVCVIPGVARFWDAQIRKGAGGGVNLFSGAQPTRMVRLHELAVGLLGERCCGVEALINDSAFKSGGGLPIDVLVRGETRIVIVREADEGGVRLSQGGKRSAKTALPPATSAIAVQGGGALPDRQSFNLSVTKPGILKLNQLSGQRPASEEGDDEYEEYDGDDGEDNESSGANPGTPTRPRRIGSSNSLSNLAARIPGGFAASPGTAVNTGLSAGFAGFGFAETMSAAADADEDITRRDIETEMLDIMDLDRALDEMESRRERGGKRVVFES